MEGEGGERDSGTGKRRGRKFEEEEWKRIGVGKKVREEEANGRQKQMRERESY